MAPLMNVLLRAFIPAVAGAIFAVIVLLATASIVERSPQYADATYILSFALMFLFSVIPILTFIFVLYFLPTAAAKGYRHRNERAIFALNLLLGWTFIGWALALVWALTDDPSPATETVVHEPPTPTFDRNDDEEELIGQKLIRALVKRLGGK